MNLTDNNEANAGKTPGGNVLNDGMNKMQKVVQKAMSVPCDPRYLEEVRKMVRESLSETTISDREKSLIVVAVDEAVGSIIGYGRERNLDSEVAVSVDIDDVRFKATVADSLNAFDLNGGLTEHQIADRVNKEKQHKLGIFLIRAIMDEITYNYKKGFENELELIRFL